MLRAISTVGLSELETRVAKATYADEDPPKPKHVDVLLRSSRDFELVSLFERRLTQQKWNVVLKTLVVIHRLSLDGSDRFIQDLAGHPHMFNLTHFTDPSSLKASAHSKFIRVYSEYLAEKAYVYKLIGVSNERRTPSESQKWAMKLPIHDVCRALPSLEDQFEKLLLCHPSADFDLNHPIPIGAVALLVKDAFRLYSVLTVLMLVILEKFESMSIEQTKLAVKCAARFLEQNERFKKWTQRLATMRFVQPELLPNFDTIPSSFISLLKEHLHHLETGGAAGPSSARPKKGKKGKKQAEPEPEPEDEEEVMEIEVDAEDHEDEEQPQEQDEDEEQAQPKKVKLKKGKKGKAKAAAPPEEEEDAEAEPEEEVVTTKKKKVVKKGKKKKKPSQEIQEEDDEPADEPEGSPQPSPRDEDTDYLSSHPQHSSHNSLSQFHTEQKTSTPSLFDIPRQQQQQPQQQQQYQLQPSRSNPNDLYSQLSGQGQQQGYGQQQQGYGQQQQGYGQQQGAFYGQPQQQPSPFFQQQQQQQQAQIPYYSQNPSQGALVPYGQQQPPGYTPYGQPSQQQQSPFQLFQAQGTPQQQQQQSFHPTARQSSISNPAFLVTRADPFSNLPTNRTDFTAAAKPTAQQTKPTSSLDTLNPFATFSSNTSRQPTTSTSRSQPMNQSQAQAQTASQPPIASFDPFAGI